MTLITADQIEMLETQGKRIDETFAEIAGILKQRDLDPVAKKKLTRVIGMLNKVSGLITDLVQTEDEEPERKAPKEKKVPAKKAPAKAAKATTASVRKSRR